MYQYYQERKVCNRMVYTKNSDPVLVTNINKLIYLLYVLFPSLSSLSPLFLPARCPSDFFYPKNVFESLHFPPLNVVYWYNE